MICDSTQCCVPQRSNKGSHILPKNPAVKRLGRIGHTDFQRDSTMAGVNPEICHTQFIKTEIKEEVHEESGEGNLILDEQSKQNGESENNNLFSTTNQQIDVKIEIKDEPIWFESSSVDTNDVSEADLWNENKEAVVLLNGPVEDEELHRLHIEARV